MVLAVFDQAGCGPGGRDPGRVDGSLAQIRARIPVCLQLLRRAIRQPPPAGGQYGAGGALVYADRHFDHLPGAVRSVDLYGATAQQGDRHPEGVGRHGAGHYRPVVEGFPQAGGHRSGAGHPGGLVFPEQLAGQFRLPDRPELVDLRPDGRCRPADRAGDGELSECSGGADESGG